MTQETPCPPHPEAPVGMGDATASESTMAIATSTEQKERPQREAMTTCGDVSAVATWLDIPRASIVEVWPLSQITWSRFVRPAPLDGPTPRSTPTATSSHAVSDATPSAQPVTSATSLAPQRHQGLRERRRRLEHTLSQMTRSRAELSDIEARAARLSGMNHDAGGFSSLTAEVSGDRSGLVQDSPKNEHYGE